MIPKLLAPHAERVYALLRMVSGFTFACHGAQKLFGVLGGEPPPIGSQIWIGGVIEFLAGSAIALGLLASWAAFLASGTMAVAYFQFHWKFQLGSMFFPAVNQGELAVVYCFLFLFIACKGSGIWSIDSVWRSRRK